MKMDEIAAKVDEKVVIQGGEATIPVQYAQLFKYTSVGSANSYIRQAKLIVSHAGIGTIINARQFNKPLIIVPRLKSFGEHLDDHQLEIAQAMAQEPAIRVVYDIKNLENIVREMLNFIEVRSFISQPPPKKASLLRAIREFVEATD